MILYINHLALLLLQQYINCLVGVLVQAAKKLLVMETFIASAFPLFEMDGRDQTIYVQVKTPEKLYMVDRFHQAI